ncbi:MAG TPA: hypothetical protein VEA63_12180, partial [Opitutus sp.]|nr:hypothetical protein [Opitutus sp.]
MTFAIRSRGLFRLAAALFGLLSLPSLHAQFQGLGSLWADDPIPFSEAYALSSDGSTVVGVSVDGNGDLRSFRWTAATGMQALPVINSDWYGFGYGYSEAFAVSHDGSVIVGSDYNLDEDQINGGTIQGYRWTAGATPAAPGTITGLPYVDPDYTNSIATGVSADGSVVVGREGGDGRAFRWTAATGTVLIGDANSEANAVSADGSVVVGTSESNAFRWTEAEGLETLAIPDANSSEAYAISADRSTIVGSFITNADLDAFNGIERAFAWTTSGVRELDALFAGDYVATHAHAVSADGRWAVGHSGESYAESAVLWDITTGNIWDLNEL